MKGLMSGDVASYTSQRAISIPVYFESYGCSANRFDLEVMIGILENLGCRLVDNVESADVILVNTCGVKKPTEDRVLNRIKRLGLLNKPLIIAGCLPKINPSAIYQYAPNFAAMLDPYSVDRIDEAVKAALKGERNRVFFSEHPKVKILQPKIRLNRFVEIIQISEGCVGSCSFCCVRFARGRLFSYPKEAIVNRVRAAVHEGVREIWLSSQDNGAYGLDVGTNLADLLKECCNVDGDFWIRVGMMNPTHILKIIDPLVKIYKDEKIFKFIHVPVQSGDDEVLRLMNRKYSVEEFKRIISMFREEIPDITVSTDVICGFPGESEEAFDRTVKLMEEIKPDIINVSRFFPRPRTPAERLKQLPVHVVKERSRLLSEVSKRISYERNKKWVDWRGKILIDEKGKGDSWIGRNAFYKPIVVRSEEDVMGQYLHVRVVKAHPTFLEAEIIR